MSAIPAKVKKRFSTNVRNFSKILEDAKKRDINESDTVNIIVDMLAEVFGYDKYYDVTSEFAIRGTYCDLAIKDGNDVRYLIECKAVGIELKENHLRQAVDYAARAGIDWVLLTNGIEWQVYKVTFTKPIEMDLILSLDFINEGVREAKFLEKLYILSKEAIRKSVIESFQEERKALDKNTIAAIIQSEEILKIIRKKIRTIFKGVSVDTTSIGEIIRNDVLKRELVSSEDTKNAIKTINRSKPHSKRRRAPIAEKQTANEHRVDIADTGLEVSNEIEPKKELL